MKNTAMDDFVERVRSASDIYNVIAAYVPLKRKGNRYWGCCPFHQEKTPSFSVIPDEGFFYCFGCHVGGNVFKFLSLIENVSYFEAIKLQAERLGIPLPEKDKTEEEMARDQKRSDLLKLLEMARDFFHSCLVRTPYGAPGLSYFASRDITAKTIEIFGLGFSPDSFNKLKNAFAKRGISERLLLESGLLAERSSGSGTYDRFRGRVMIPISDERGRVVGFGGRVIAEGEPKYLNSPETMVFNKRKLLFGLDRSKKAIRQAGHAILVEGYMDAISVFGAGVENVAASLGTAFTVDQCRLLLRYAPEILFCYDSDVAGQKATMRALSIIRETGARARVLIIPDGKDPDEFIRRHGAEAFRELIRTALPLVEFQIQNSLRHGEIQTMEGKARMLQTLLPILKECANAVEQNGYIAKVSREIGIDEGIIRQELEGYRGMAADSLRTARPLRQVAIQVDDAVRRAGRIVIRQVWNDSGTLLDLTEKVPLDSFPYKLHGEILRYLEQQAEVGEPADDAAALSQLSEAASDELSRALVEDVGDADFMVVYDDCVKVLRKNYLAGLVKLHLDYAKELEEEGKDCRQELEEIQRINKEMDAL